MSKKEPFNPFYAMLVVVGTLFAVTAFAYGVMAFTAVQRGPIRVGASPGQRLLVFLDRRGTWILAGELALLAIATVGAIGSDRYWAERAARRHGGHQAGQRAERLANDDASHAEARTETRPPSRAERRPDETDRSRAEAARDAATATGDEGPEVDRP